ncbi:hypothetical protein GCM10022214_88100 [Actinomadura miaoliensis]|uniref:Uncharacterized protein n=1 Tax=Actinomadura miaoliensis TaxID=430685 RepID=A0ABP7X944_9ACTN
MGDLAADAAVTGENGHYTAELSPEWAAWGPNGGHLTAILVRAALVWLTADGLDGLRHDVPPRPHVPALTRRLGGDHVESPSRRGSPRQGAVRSSRPRTARRSRRGPRCGR